MTQVFGDKSFYFGFGREPFVKAKCPVSSCFTTANRSLFPPEKVDAVIWHVRSHDNSFPPLRSPHTRYVFWSLESPPHMFIDLRDFDNVFNWTFTYRLDSDFPNPYSTVYRRRIPKPLPVSKNYAFGKKRLAAWFVSNCITDSGRETLVETLQRWIKIDVYGSCGPFKCDRDDGQTNCYEMLERNYKFYLSFENSLCKDYATEKLFSILRYNVVPVVYGLGNYTVQLPPDSYIDALDFPTAKSLAAYLHYLDRNDTAYNAYFRPF
ncbi:alpha-(1,3)-fucosyltransferase C-like isoform X2 [Macrobrachium nipponense]|uniref:alpha-(1,3)-fucosyltransferase C-like isoform X2 n=1 Tax=Macrobrachium nipponense TaxID=159736 RepID=UPI0030C8BA52